MVGDIGRWDEGKVVWDLGWSRSFFIYEEPVVEEFFLLLQGFQFSEERDSWICRHVRDAMFSIASAYQSQLDYYSTLDPPLVSGNSNLPLIWETWAASKILVFFGKFCKIDSFLRKIFSSVR